MVTYAPYASCMGNCVYHFYGLPKDKDGSRGSDPAMVPLRV